MTNPLVLLLIVPFLCAAQTQVSDAVQTVAIDLLDAGRKLFHLTLLTLTSILNSSSHIDILHFLDIVDAFGHVSVRNPDNASQFLMYVPRNSYAAPDGDVR